MKSVLLSKSVLLISIIGFLVQSLILCYSMEEGAVLSTDSYSYIGSAQSFINGNGILHHPLHHIKKPINLSYAPGLSVCYALLNKIGIEWQWIPVIANIIFWFSTHLLFFLFIFRLFDFFALIKQKEIIHVYFYFTFFFLRLWIIF